MLQYADTRYIYTVALSTYSFMIIFQRILLFASKAAWSWTYETFTITKEHLRIPTSQYHEMELGEEVI